MLIKEVAAWQTYGGEQRPRIGVSFWFVARTEGNPVDAPDFLINRIDDLLPWKWRKETPLAIAA